MMYKEYKLSHFFLCAFILVFLLGSFITYAWRKNAPANITNENGVDVSTPFYAGEKPENAHKEIGTNHSAVDFPGSETESSHEEKKSHEAPNKDPEHEGQSGHGEKNEGHGH